MRNPFHFDPREVAVDGRTAVRALGRPLHVEVGFGKDVRILREAEQRPDEWFLGVEISRKKAVKFCQKVARAGLRNVRAYQGDVRFQNLGSGGLNKMVKSKLTGEGVQMMHCEGSGELFLADFASEIQIFYLDNDMVSINGANVLAL